MATIIQSLSEVVSSHASMIREIDIVATLLETDRASDGYVQTLAKRLRDELAHARRVQQKFIVVDDLARGGE